MPAPSTHGGSALVGARIFFLTGHGAAGQATLGTEAIDLADADGELTLLVEGLLDAPTGNGPVGTAKGLKQHDGIPTEFGGMAVPSLGQGRLRIGVESALKPSDGGPMEGNGREGLLGREGGDNLLFGRALGDCLWFNGHGTSRCRRWVPQGQCSRDGLWCLDALIVKWQKP